MKTRLVAVVTAATCCLIVAGYVAGAWASVITAGISMQPRIHAGDLVVVVAASSYEVGDVVAYDSDMLDTVVMHRIVAIQGDRYVFQGDNNSWLDPEKLTREQLVGKEWLHIPGGGIWLHRITSPPALAAVAFLLTVGGSTAAHMRRRRRRERRSMSSHTLRNRRVFGVAPTSLRSVAAAVAALGLAGAALGAFAWTRPIETVVSAERTLTSTVDFSYAATVPLSAAYDGTVVTDPQPVFRRLTDTVDVGFRYEGQPGTVTVDAELSTSGGWTSTVRLADPVRLDNGRYDGTVRLDLSALQARAEAAAAVTGLPANSINVAVVPRVSVDGGGEFAPRLALTLDPLALRLNGDESSTVENATSVSGSRPERAELTAFGTSVSVAAARAVSFVTLGLAALGALVLLLVMRRTGPVAEGERIRRKHGQLLLHVLPVAVTPGRPVVEVPDVASLARLAERYGLLVLHWSRSGVDTYLVQDEGTTYRYRIGDITPAMADEQAAASY